MNRLAGMIIASSRTDYKVLSSNLSWLLIGKTSFYSLVGALYPILHWYCLKYLTSSELISPQSYSLISEIWLLSGNLSWLLIGKTSFFVHPILHWYYLQYDNITILWYLKYLTSSEQILLPFYSLISEIWLAKPALHCTSWWDLHTPSYPDIIWNTF